VREERDMERGAGKFVKILKILISYESFSGYDLSIH